MMRSRHHTHHRGSAFLLAVALLAALACTSRAAAAAAKPARPKLVPIDIRLPHPDFPEVIGLPIGEPNLAKLPRRPRPPFLAPVGTVNLALHRPVTSSETDPIDGDLEQITDGDKDCGDGGYVELGPGQQWVQIDLEQRVPIYAILVWHHWTSHWHFSYLVCRDVIVRVADDSDFRLNVRTLFNNDHDNSSGLGAGKDRGYGETYEGKLIDAKGVKARFVRLYSNGSSVDDLNRYVEVEVYGLGRQKQRRAAEDGPARNLFEALERSDQAAAEAFLAKGASLDGTDRFGRKPLHVAAENGAQPIVELLLRRGAKVDTLDTSRLTALQRAARRGHLEIVKILLARGAKIDAAHRWGSTPLVEAAANGRESVVKLLVASGADVNATGPGAKTAIRCAVSRRQTDLVRFLLAHGAKVQAGYHEPTALHDAASGGYRAIAKLLLDKGAGVDARGRGGDTPLIWAAAYGHDDVARLLLARGANVNARNSRGISALHEAAYEGHMGTVEVLVANKAEVNTEDHKGRTPLDLAIEAGEKATAALLRKHGAR